MIDADCYDQKPVAQAVAKAEVHKNPTKVNTSPGHVQKRAVRKPIYLKDKEPGVAYPCDSPSLPSAALPVEPEPFGEFTPVPPVALEPTSWLANFEQPTPEVPPTFETACGCGGYGGAGSGGFGGGGGYGGGYLPPVSVPSPVPEPSSLAFVGAGFLMLLWRRRK